METQVRRGATRWRKMHVEKQSKHRIGLQVFAGRRKAIER